MIIHSCGWAENFPAHPKMRSGWNRNLRTSPFKDARHARAPELQQRQPYAVHGKGLRMHLAHPERFARELAAQHPNAQEQMAAQEETKPFRLITWHSFSLAGRFHMEWRSNDIHRGPSVV